MIELHIFTNCTHIINEKKTIVDSYESFCQAVGQLIIPTIWIDVNPNRLAFDEYVKYLKHHFPHSTINKTGSLSNGYIRMVDETTSEFLFVLEHDWVFKSNIDLDSTLNIMKTNSICHLRFNSHCNDVLPLESFEDYASIEFYDDHCITQSASNNPHLLWTPLYKETARKYLRIENGSHGIEQNLRKIPDCKFAIYGGKSMEAIVMHTDGRGCWS